MSMTYEVRTRRIFDFLYNSDNGLLRRYTKPETLSDTRAREEIEDMVREINKDIPTSVGDASFDLFLGELASQVKRRHGARTWPTIKVLVAATIDALARMDSLANTGDAETAMIDMLVAWYQQHGGCMPSCGSAKRTRAIINRGVLTAREARIAGFPLSDEDQKLAHSEPMGEKERTKHIRVMARLWGVGELEAEARLTAEGDIPREQLQKELDAVGVKF